MQKVSPGDTTLTAVLLRRDNQGHVRQNTPDITERAKNHLQEKQGQMCS